MQPSERSDGEVKVIVAIAATATLAIILGFVQGVGWADAAAREARIDWDTTGGVKGLGEAIDHLLAIVVIGIGGLVLAIPAAAIVANSRLPRRRSAFAGLIAVMTLALLVGLAVGSGIGDPEGFLAGGYLVAATLLTLFTVTIGALVGFGIGSLIRRNDQPVTTGDQTPTASSAP